MINQIIPGTDNFFKYLMTIGIVLFLFAFIYPLQKQQELELEVIDLNKKNELLTAEIKSIGDEYNGLLKIKKSLEDELGFYKALYVNDSIKYKGKEFEIIKEFQKQKEALNKANNLIQSKTIGLKFEYRRVEAVKDQIRSFFYFKMIFLSFGIFFSLAGFRFWLSSAYMEDYKKGQDIGNGYSTFFVRCNNWVKFHPILFVLISIFLLLIVCFFCIKILPH